MKSSFENGPKVQSNDDVSRVMIFTENGVY